MSANRTRLGLAIAAGLALADASIVTLALPQLLTELDASVEGVAAVIGVYTVVLALALLPFARLVDRYGAARVGAAALGLFGLACIGCAAAGSLELLLVLRAVQAIGGAGGLVAAFSLLGAGDAGSHGRRLWSAAAVIGFAAGPALGGVLTQAFDWRAIFVAQVPVALVGAAACGLLRADDAAGGGEAPAEGEATAGGEDAADGGSAEPGRAPGGRGSADAGGSAEPGGTAAPGGTTSAGGMSIPRGYAPPPGSPRGPYAALALLSAALTAVLFLLVLLLVAGWNTAPIAAAAAVSVLPLAALATRNAAGDPRMLAATGCVLVAAGTLCLAFLPLASLWWTVVPQALAGAGIGLALPRLAGDLLPERTPRDAARLLTARHAGIALALLILAPVVAGKLDDATQLAKERGVAIVLDSPLPPESKIELAPALLDGVDDAEPRHGLERAISSTRDRFEGSERAQFDRLGERADDTLIEAVGESFRLAFLITAALALAAALVLVPPSPTRRAALARITAAAVVIPLLYVLLHATLSPEPVKIADPCKERKLPSASGITGFLQTAALTGLDAVACHFGSSREELVLAIADESEARRYERKYGVNPRSAGITLNALGGG